MTRGDTPPRSSRLYRNAAERAFEQGAFVYMQDRQALEDAWKGFRWMDHADYEDRTLALCFMASIRAAGDTWR